jgi:hypothetical protein
VVDHSLSAERAVLAVGHIPTMRYSVPEPSAGLQRCRSWVIEHAYHGTDSAVNCGGNSDYTGTWIITRIDR